MKLRILQLGLTLIAIASALCPSRVYADGGTLQLAQDVGGYRITVFMAPAPLRVGPVDLSVLVQDAETGNPIQDARVEFHLSSREKQNDSTDATATQEAATNKLLQAALFSLPSAGTWDVVVNVSGPKGPARVQFAFEAARPLPSWRNLWPWFSWPAVFVALFGLQQFLAYRDSHQRGRRAIRQHDHVGIAHSS